MQWRHKCAGFLDTSLIKHWSVNNYKSVWSNWRMIENLTPKVFSPSKLYVRDRFHHNAECLVSPSTYRDFAVCIGVSPWIHIRIFTFAQCTWKVAERQIMNMVCCNTTTSNHCIGCLYSSCRGNICDIHMHVKEYYNPSGCETYIVKWKARFHHYFILFDWDHFLITALFY